MPFSVLKRQKNKVYYSQHREKIKSASKSYYNENKEKIIEKSKSQKIETALTNPVKYRSAAVLRKAKQYYKDPEKSRSDVKQRVLEYRQQNPEQTSINTRISVADYRQRDPERARAATRKGVSRYRQREPEKALTSTRGSVYKYYYKDREKSRSSTKQRVLLYRKKNPGKCIVNNRYWVAKCYVKCLQRNRSLSRVSTAKHYNKDIESSRRKSKYASRIFYRKNAPIISRQKRDSYFLAEPRQQKITCLLKVFQDIFYSNKKVRSQIMKSLDGLPMYKVKKGQATNYALCKLAASHLVRLSLLERKRAVNTFLQVKRGINKLELGSEADFGKCYNTTSREPYFYEAAYDYFEGCNGQAKGFNVNTFKCKALPNPIPVQENGHCHLSDISSCIKSTETPTGDSKSQSKGSTDSQTQTNKWSCSPRCKRLSDNEIATIVSLKNVFDNDIPDLRKVLEECDKCPHVHSYKQEWHVLVKKNKEHIEQKGLSDYLDLESEDKSFRPVERKGHPLACHLPGSSCESKLRVLTAAVAHYPKLAAFQKDIYTARREHFVIQNIDNAIESKDYTSLLEICGTSFLNLFKRQAPAPVQSESQNDVQPVSALRIPHLEAQLLIEHAKVIKQFDKQVHDYAIHPCACCERLHKRSCVKEVYFDDFQPNNVWLTIKAYAILSCPDVGDDPVYLCNYCRPKVKAGVMPGRCVINGLESPPIPKELKDLDLFTVKFLQLAKAFQTVVRLSTYTNKVPSYNSLKACRGNMFILPLPLEKTIKTLSESELPKPELYVIVDGAPTKEKVIWRSFVDIKKIKAALNKLKEVNWLYKNVKLDSVEKSAEKDLVVEETSSASSEMVIRVKNKAEYTAGLQAYTVRTLNKTVPNSKDIDQYKLVHVEDYPLKSNQINLDLMLYPNLFPTGEFGEHHPRSITLRNAEYVKSRLTNKDSRYRKSPEYIFWLLHQKLMRELKAGIYNLLKTSRQADRTVADLINKIENNDSELEGNLSTILRSVRGTKQYWLARRNEVTCMIREFGPPTLFLTFSCAEYDSADITEYLKLVNGLSPNSNPNIAQLCTEDPVSVSRQFSSKFHAFFNTVIIKGEILGKVSDYYCKKEYQARGAPHYHVLLWIEGAPVIGIDPPEEVLSWIQSRITSHIPDPETNPELYHLVTRYQMHKCSAYCLRTRKVKGVKGKKMFIRQCKFNFPRPECSHAQLNPVDSSLKTRQRIYSLSRANSEVRVNDYNPLILYLWRANVDIQFVAESSLALAGYVSAYVEKSNLQDIWTEVASKENIYSKLWSFGVRAVKSREVGLYEATDLLLGDHLTQKSRDVKFVNARQPQKRSRMLKNYTQLKELKENNPDSDDVFAPSLVDVHYPSRPSELEDLCLYDFVKYVDWYHRDKDGKKTYRRLAKPRVPNHPTYDPRKLEQVDDYYYSLILLFVPFRDENDLLLSNETPEQAFNRYNSEGLLGHHEKLMKMLEAMTTRQKITEARKEVDVSKDDGNDNCGPEIVGKVKSDYDKIMKLDACQDPLDLPTRVSMLNADQKRVYDGITGHLVHQQKHEDSQCQCSDLKPLQMFVSGVGGTGKSFLIEAIRTFVKNTWPGLDNTTAVAAPTGLAACNVSGVTIYQLFQLPVEHDSKTAQYWALPKDSLKFLRMQLNNVKVFIIDEVSMVSSLNLAYVHLRLEEIFGGEEWFGGKTMLFVGDILQLPPVNGVPVFQSIPNQVVALRLGCITTVNICKETVVYDELTINERQKSDLTYSKILDEVRRGSTSEESIKILQERVIHIPVVEKYSKLKDQGKAPICLFPTRKACEEVNTQLLNSLPSKIIQLHCTDEIDEASAPFKWNKKAQQYLKLLNKDCNMTAGLEQVLNLAVGARVMLRRNINTEYGLVNGAIGTVLAITSASVTVKFDNIPEPYEVTKIKSRFCVLKHFYIHREQFPLILAFSITIHKSQGLSLDNAIIDLSNKVFGDSMAYVALSRVRSLSGVHLTEFSSDSIMASRICIEEVNRLRQKFRPDLPCYQLPPKKGVKRKMTGVSTVPPVKKQKCDPSSQKKRKCSDLSDCPPAKRQKTSQSTDSSSIGDTRDPRDINPRESGVWGFPYYPLDVATQKSACELLNLRYRQPNRVVPGGPNIPLKRPDLKTLRNTVGDGSCLFRAFSILLTGTQHQHKQIRKTIVQHLIESEHLFVNNVMIFDRSKYRSVQAYIRGRSMDLQGWGGSTELYAISHLLKKRVYTYTALTGTWESHCPSRVDQSIAPPSDKQGLYVYHTGDHYMVVTSLST